MLVLSMAVLVTPLHSAVPAIHRGVEEVGEEGPQAKAPIPLVEVMKVLALTWQMLGHCGHVQKISGRLSGGASTAVSCTSGDGRDGMPG